MTNKGIVCAARCCAFKKDLINETYSVTLNLRVAGGDGTSIASGTNISFNNLSDEGFREFKRMLDVDTIDEDTPFIVQLLCPTGREDVAFVQMSLTEGDKKLAKSVRKNVRNNVDEYTIARNRRIYLLADGRLVNLSCAEGHPASVMDMSFATQALTAEYFTRGAKRTTVRVHEVPDVIENWVSRLKLKSMGIAIDSLTPEQKKYLASWDMGT